jgi:glucokinase
MSEKVETGDSHQPRKKATLNVVMDNAAADEEMMASRSPLLKGQKLHVLIGDIGGTNCRLELVDLQSEKVVKYIKYVTNDYPSLVEPMSDFLEEFKGTDKWPKFGCLCCAGPVENNAILGMANSRWSGFSGQAVGEAVGVKYIKLLNDFESVGYAMIGMPSEKLIQLNPDRSEYNMEPGVVIVGPGTGLGVVRINDFTWEGDRKFKVVPMEGGHMPIGARNQKEYDLHKHIKSKIGNTDAQYLQAEMTCCGSAIPLIYDFLK